MGRQLLRSSKVMQCPRFGTSSRTRLAFIGDKISPCMGYARFQRLHHLRAVASWSRELVNRAMMSSFHVKDVLEVGRRVAPFVSLTFSLASTQHQREIAYHVLKSIRRNRCSYFIIRSFVTMAGSHVPQSANLPEYAGPGLPTRARNVVKALTELPERFIEYVDENVAARKEDLRSLRVESTDELELPPDSHVKGLLPHGAAYWTRTAAIQTEQADGSPLDFFLKVRWSCC